jgi:hypothetical protein
MKEKLKFVFRKCFRDMRERSKLEVCQSLSISSLNFYDTNSILLDNLDIVVGEDLTWLL